MSQEKHAVRKNEMSKTFSIGIKIYQLGKILFCLKSFRHNENHYTKSHETLIDETMPD